MVVEVDILISPLSINLAHPNLQKSCEIFRARSDSVAASPGFLDFPDA